MPSIFLTKTVASFCWQHGISTVCAMNRISTRALLSILINLHTLMHEIARAMANEAGHENKSALNFLSAAIPAFLAMLGSALVGTRD
jgi:hypothetical protein